MKQTKYPTVYEIKEILSHIANRDFLTSFAQERGIFITNATQEHFASELANLFYDDEDLEIIRAEAYGEVHSHNLTGFLVHSSSPGYSLNTAYESIRQNGEREQGVVLSALRNVSSNGETPVYKGTITYQRKKLARIEFLEDDKFHSDFFMRKVNNHIWQVEVECSKSSDIKEIKKIFTKNLPMGQYSLQEIDETRISVENSISFFDQLCTKGLDDKWSFTGIKHISVKKDNLVHERNDEEDDGDDGEEAITTLVEEAITGISKAILEGKDIRQDEFIKTCVSKGFRFSAMTYLFEHKNDPYSIEVTAEFKGRPRVFEVGISQVQETNGITSTRANGQLPMEKNRIVRSLFWNNAKKLYEGIKNFKPSD